MDIEKIWKGHQPETAGLPQLQNIGQLQPDQNTPLKKMKKLLTQNMVGLALCIAMYVAIIYFFGYWQIRGLIGITLVFTLWAFISAQQLYKSVNDEVQADNLLAELKRNRDALTRWMRIQMQVSVIIYPFSAAGGYLWGGVLASGKNVSAFMGKPSAWWVLMACVVILPPLGYMAGKWMFKKTFGRVVRLLDNNIDNLMSGNGKSALM